MVAIDRLDGDSSPEYKALLDMFDERLEHSGNALIELKKTHFGTEEIRVYHSGKEYPVDRYVSIISHITQIMDGDETIPNYTTARVSGVTSEDFPDEAPDSADTFDKYNL